MKWVGLWFNHRFETGKFSVYEECELGIDCKSKMSKDKLPHTLIQISSARKANGETFLYAPYSNFIWGI